MLRVPPGRPLSAIAHPALGCLPVAGLTPVSLADANALLAEWGHYLGPVTRPFGSQAWMFEIDGRPVSVAVSASIVSASVTVHEGHDVRKEPCTTSCRTYQRGQVIELARLCSSISERWATRVLLRLWREVAAPRWPYWPLRAAIAYSQNDRHDGRIYRFDGWGKGADNCGSSGGGAWSRKRYAADAAHGKKTLWVWEYPA
ncbi:MAG: hypothetical protein LC798_16980 [Chloroflexi bacterium]|nr:hypothetical protein [Chloroflexota bacterium]